MSAPLQLRSLGYFFPLSSRFDRTRAAWFSTFLFCGSSLKNTTCSAVQFSLPSSISYRYSTPAGPRMKQITRLWNGWVGGLAFCLCFKCSLELDARTFTDSGALFYLLSSSVNMDRCSSSPAEHFSGFLILAEDVYFCMIHFIPSCCECMNTHADRSLLLIVVCKKKIPHWFSIFLHMGSR